MRFRNLSNIYCVLQQHNHYKACTNESTMGEEYKQSERSGLSAEEFFERGRGIAYEQFNILDTDFTDVVKSDVSLATDLGKGVVLQTPLIAAPMDTIANSRLCIALALQGGIGAIHYNHRRPDQTPDIDAQAEEIAQVKRFHNGFIQDPITVSPEMTIQQAIDRGNRFIIDGSPIENFPVTADGTSNGKLVGLLRKQDYFSGSRTQQKVAERMLPRKEFIVERWPITLEQARERLWELHLPLLPITDDDDRLKYLVTRSDMEKLEKYPLATLDEYQRLRVLFAVDTRPEKSYERLEKGFAVGADGVIIDTSQGYSRHERDMIAHIQQKYPDKLLIGGNISTSEAAQFLARAGVDAYRCGQGVGSICTTAGAIGIAREAATSVYECAKAVRNSTMKTIADGGMREVGDVFKSLALGAHCSMVGYLLAATEECPGEFVPDRRTGLPVKVYRGMGSVEANVGGNRGYSRLPEGKQGTVESRGSIHRWVPLIRDGLLHAFEVRNYRTIADAHQELYEGRTRFELRKERKEESSYRRNEQGELL